MFDAASCFSLMPFFSPVLLSVLSCSGRVVTTAASGSCFGVELVELEWPLSVSSTTSLISPSSSEEFAHFCSYSADVALKFEAVCCF